MYVDWKGVKGTSEKNVERRREKSFGNARNYDTEASNLHRIQDFLKENCSLSH